ncbi:MAG: LacI family DNA-binding transcriptional regulator [Candidatus Saelkia tenebricola]|nr:LacI family DNA-binding transcriptional regulator [Candidatus Saelkia tenebricola]
MENLTIKDVAKKAGVSIATISRALNPETRNTVKLETVQKIQDVVTELGYLPNNIASSLRRRKSKTIGFPYNFQKDVTSGYVSGILSGVLRGLNEIGYGLKLMPVKDTHSLLALIDKQGIDGIIFTHASYIEYSHLEINENAEKILPVVVINDSDSNQGVNRLYVNSYDASRTMAEYVLRKSGPKVFIIGGNPDDVESRLRKAAFLDVLREKEMQFSEHRYLDGKFSEQGGYEASKTAFEKEPEFRGVLYCLNDAMAIGAIRAVGELGLHCPGDIKIIGFDDVFQTEFTNPPLTTMRFPLSNMGHEAVMLIYRILKGEIKQYIKKEFPHELIIRASC